MRLSPRYWQPVEQVEQEEHANIFQTSKHGGTSGISGTCECITDLDSKWRKWTMRISPRYRHQTWRNKWNMRIFPRHRHTEEQVEPANLSQTCTPRGRSGTRAYLSVIDTRLNRWSIRISPRHKHPVEVDQVKMRIDPKHIHPLVQVEQVELINLSQTLSPIVTGCS